MMGPTSIFLVVNLIMDVFSQNLEGKLDAGGYYDGNIHPYRAWRWPMDQGGYGLIVVRWPNGHRITQRLKEDFPRRTVTS